MPNTYFDKKYREIKPVLHCPSKCNTFQGFLKDGYELINEALNLLNNVYGAMHPEIAQCLRMLARLNYIMGEHSEAMAYQQKAVLMSERVNGIDHPYTITEYTHLALYCFANSQISMVSTNLVMLNKRTGTIAGFFGRFSATLTNSSWQYLEFIY